MYLYYCCIHTYIYRNLTIEYIRTNKNEQIKGIMAMEKMRMAGMAYNVFKKPGPTIYIKKINNDNKTIIENKYNIIYNKVMSLIVRYVQA